LVALFTSPLLSFWFLPSSIPSSLLAPPFSCSPLLPPSPHPYSPAQVKRGDMPQHVTSASLVHLALAEQFTEQLEAEKDVLEKENTTLKQVGNGRTARKGEEERRRRN
jgi:hypothetical protein